MSSGKYNKPDSQLTTYSSVVYYGPLDRSREIDPILQICQETNGDGLIIDDNTVYEIDCDCYQQMLLRKAKKENMKESKQLYLESPNKT